MPSIARHAVSEASLDVGSANPLTTSRPDVDRVDEDPRAGGVAVISRREVIESAGLAAAAVALPSPAAAARADAFDRVELVLTVNGRRHALTLDPRVTLLDALREHLRLTGSKKGCDHGQCGACTVLVDGRRINACLTLAVMHDGDAITTIEGLGTPEAMGAMQAAFVANDGFQCGYCTPEQMCSATAMLDEIERGVPSHVSTDLTAIAFSDDEVRERMSGNICRCAAYPNILAAIRDVHARRAS